MNVGPVPGGPPADRPTRLWEHSTGAPDIHRRSLHAEALGNLGDADGVTISHEKSVAKVLTVDQGCSDNQYMTQPIAHTVTLSTGITVVISDMGWYVPNDVPLTRDEVREAWEAHGEFWEGSDR